jgi:hypothetical protein
LRVLEAGCGAGGTVVEAGEQGLKAGGRVVEAGCGAEGGDSEVGLRVVEAGCGAGDALGVWVNEYRAASVVGLEVVPSQQQLAAERLQVWMAVRGDSNHPTSGLVSRGDAFVNEEGEHRSSTGAAKRVSKHNIGVPAVLICEVALTVR